MATGSGTIAEIQFIIKDDVLPKSNSSFIRLDFNIIDIKFIDSIGVEIPVTPLLGQIMVTDNITGVQTLKFVQNKVRAFPNPTTGILRVDSRNKKIEAVQLFDLRGRLVQQKTAVREYQTDIDMKILPEGMYILQVNAEGEYQNIKVLKK